MEHLPADNGDTASQIELSAAVIPLLKGVVYQESMPEVWKALLNLQGPIRDFVTVLGLELLVDEAEGYGFLRSRSDDDGDDTAKRPRLIARRPLSFPVSLLLALLRKKLAEFDAGGGDTRLVLTRDDILDLLRVFLPDGTNEARLVDRVDTDIRKVADMGFLRPMRGQKDRFEVRRVLKAYVDAQWLAEFGRRLESYRTHLGNTSESTSDE